MEYHTFHQNSSFSLPIIVTSTGIAPKPPPAFSQGASSCTSHLFLGLFLSVIVMSEEHYQEYSSRDNNHNGSCEGKERQISSPTQLPGVSIDADAGYDTISTLNSVPKILIEAPPPPPPCIPTRETTLDESNLTKKYAPPRKVTRSANRHLIVRKRGEIIR